MNTIYPKTREAVLAIAAWQIGTCEFPANSNKVKYNTAYYGRSVSGSAYPWCMAFVWWVFREAGFNLKKTASCSTLTTAYKNAGQWVTEGYKPGDIVMFDFSGKRTKTEHTGIVESVSADGRTLTTIEGNTSTSDNCNGGEVMRRTRNVKLVTGACRPGYNL